MSKNRPYAVVISEEGNDSNWLGTSRSLGKKGVPVIRLSPKGWYASKYCTTVISPGLSEEPQKCLDFLLRVGEKLARRDCSKPFLMPASDNSLILLSKNKAILKEFFVPVASDWDCVKKIVDKSETYSAASKIGIRVPKTYQLNNLDDLNEFAGIIPFPCLVKPAHSHIFTVKFNCKLFEVQSKKSLINTCTPLLAEGHKLLIQEKIPGADHRIFTFGTCFNEKSEPLAVFTQQKLRQIPPHYGIGSFGQSVWNPEIIDLGAQLLKQIGFFGIAGVEFKKDSRTGEYVLIEINGRSDTRMYLATTCGLNIPYILYNDLIHKKQEPLKNYVCKYRLGVKWVHLKNDFISMLQQRKLGEITFASWLKTLCARNKTYGIFSLDDPSPFFSEMKDYIFNNWLTKNLHL